MKFALSTSLALLAALSYAEQELKMTSAKDNLMNKVMTRKNRLFTKLRQETDWAEEDESWEDDWADEWTWEDDLGVLPPDRSCLVWENSEEGECYQQWWQWEDACWWDWTDMCETVDDHWYAQDIDWYEPTVPAEECWYEDMDSDECWDQWDTVWSQCFGQSDDGLPYQWTDVCDAVDHLGQFVDLHYWLVGYDEDDNVVWEDDWLVLARKMDKHVQKKQAAKKTAGANVKLLAQVAEPVEAAASKKHSERISNAAIVGGISIATLSGIAALAFCMKKSAKRSEDEFLLQ